MKLRTLNPQISKGLISLNEVLSPSSALPLEILSFLPFTEEINPSLSTKPAVIFSERNVRQDTTVVPQDLPIVAARQDVRQRTAPRREVESMVHGEVH